MSVYIAALRGFGKGVLSTAIMLFSLIIARQLYLIFIVKITHSPVWVGFGYPFGWIVSAIITLIYYRSKIVPKIKCD